MADLELNHKKMDNALTVFADFAAVLAESLFVLRAI